MIPTPTTWGTFLGLSRPRKIPLNGYTHTYTANSCTLLTTNRRMMSSWFRWIRSKRVSTSAILRSHSHARANRKQLVACVNLQIFMFSSVHFRRLALSLYIIIQLYILYCQRAAYSTAIKYILLAYNVTLLPSKTAHLAGNSHYHCIVLCMYILAMGNQPNSGISIY